MYYWFNIIFLYIINTLKTKTKYHHTSFKVLLIRVLVAPVILIILNLVVQVIHFLVVLVVQVGVVLVILFVLIFYESCMYMMRSGFE